MRCLGWPADLPGQPVPCMQGSLDAPGGYKAVHGATGAGFISEGREEEQRATFPVINKAATPSILMSQGRKNHARQPRTQWDTMETLLSLYKGGKKDRQRGKSHADWKAVPNSHLHAPRRCHSAATVVWNTQRV